MAEAVTDKREEELARIQEMESSPEYQQKLQLLREKMKMNLRWKTKLLISAVASMCFFFFFKFVGLLFAAVFLFFYLYPAYKQRKELFDGKKESNELLYLEQFLTPILRQIYPNGTMSVKQDFSIDAVKTVTPSSENYRGSTELSLHDEKDLSVMNLYAYHVVENTDSKGRKERKEVTDFYGQVFRLRFPIAFNGHIRIVPTKKTGILKREVQNYPSKLRNEVKIDTEDIEHNEHYNIYCTDELTARRFLNPTVLRWFDGHISDSATAIYIQNDWMYISRYTGSFLFPTPKSVEDVDKLSVVEEYKKLREELDFIDSFTDVFA